MAFDPLVPRNLEPMQMKKNLAFPQKDFESNELHLSLLQLPQTDGAVYRINYQTKRNTILS